MATRTEKLKRRAARKAKRTASRRTVASIRSATTVPGSLQPLTGGSVFIEPTAAVPEVPVVKIWGYIGDEVNADTFDEQLASHNGADIVVSINSGGGSVFDGISIHNSIVDYPGRVTCYVQGVAASIATFIAMACDDIHIASTALFMVHKARGGAYGTADEIRQYLDLIDRANQIMVLAYAARTGMPADDLDALLAKDWWMTAAEALDNGFVDVVEEATARVAPHVQPGAVNTSDVKSTLSVSRARHALDQLVASVRGTAKRTPPTSQGSESMKFSEWLKANGFDEAKITAAQRPILEAAWKAEIAATAANGNGNPGTPPAAAPAAPNTPAPAAPVQAAAAAPAATIAVPTVDEITAGLRDAGAAELTRQNRINLIAAQEHVDDIPVNASGEFDPTSENRVPFAQHAIANNWNALNAELVAVRCGRPDASGPATHIRGGNTMETIQASLMASSGIEEKDIIAATSEQALEAAGQQYGRAQLSLHAMLLDAAAINGYELRSVTAIRSDLRGVLQAAFSTLDLPNIITSNANRLLLNGFNAVEQGWREISAIGSVTDFKEIGSHRMTGAFEYEEVGPDGKLKHGTIGEEDFTNQAKTYGKMFGVTRTDIINDNLGALNALPRRIGRGAALKLNTVFWTEFMDNSTFFTAARNNYEDGAATALDIDSLTAAELLFLNQTDPDGKPLGIMPTRLLVPNALSVTADNLMASLHIATGSTGKNLRNNPHAGKFSTVKSSYLSNSAITGNSALAWYLLTDDEDAAVIETVFLNGQETPVVESADADFSTLGVEMRGYHDFGCSKQEHRGGVKEKGEA